MESAPVKRTLLGVVAESLAHNSIRNATVVDVVHGRAMQHYGEALRQYLSIRLGNVEGGGHALAQVRALAAARGAGEMAQHPGVRARLYRIARDVAKEHLATGGPTGDRTMLPWRLPAAGTAAPAPDALARLRTGLGEDDAELLELRYARELGEEEIAYVVDRPVAAVHDELVAAEQKARGIVGGADGDALARAALVAFALERTAPPAPVPEEEGEGESAMLAAGAVIGGRYEVQKCVGSGSFADVYRARDTSVPGHVVAIKLLHQPALTEGAREQALRELHLIASVFHPSIVQFKDHGWHDSRLWFVMPWYEGESLENRIQREAISRAEARRIFEPLARALATMHASGLRHQDVKPDNVFLARIRRFDEEGADELLPVLLDLGVAAKDAEMVVAGTPTYFAPEVAAQFSARPTGKEITNKADVFALALSLKHALVPSSEEVVEGGAVETFIERRAAEVPTPPPGDEFAYLRGAFERWLHLDPEKRPTAGELANELRMLTAPEERRARRIATLKWLVPATVGALLTFGFAVFALQQQAELERANARAAKIETAEVRADLSQATERGKELETDVANIRRRYESSKMSNDQLTTKLAETEGSLNATEGELAKARKRTRDLDQSLTVEQQKSASLTADLSSTKSHLDETRKQLDTTQLALSAEQAESARVRRELTQAKEEARIALERVSEINRELTQARADLSIARDEKRDLDRTLKQLESKRDELQTKLDAAEKRIALLERRLATTASEPKTIPVVPAQPTNPTSP